MAKLLNHTTILVGSAPDAANIAEQAIPKGSQLVAINNAWRVHPDTKQMIIPGDFPADRMPPRDRGIRVFQGRHSITAQRNAGGVLFCGATMVFTAGYFAVHNLAERHVSIFGCNMVYDGEKTHFYGKGKPDPIAKNPYTYPGNKNLKAKAVRLFAFGLLSNKLVTNGHWIEGSQLLLPKAPGSDFEPAALEKFLCSATVVDFATKAQTIFLKERKFPGNRYTMDLSQVFKNQEQMAFIDTINADWEDLGQSSMPELQAAVNAISPAGAPTH